MNINGKAAVVTGAARGIGASIASKLAEKGASRVALVDLSDKCHETASQINHMVGQKVAIAFNGDVSDPDFRKQVFDKMENDYPVKICVPAAGIIRDGLSVKTQKETGEVAIYSETDFRKILEINLIHPTYWAMETIARIAKDRMAQNLKRWVSEEGIQGAIILIGSVSSRGNRGQVGYAAAKSGLIGVSSTLNLEGLFHGVVSKIIHPGFVDTPMVESVDKDYFEDNLKPQIGLGRKILPEEIGEIVCAMIENPVLSGEVWADASMRPFA